MIVTDRIQQTRHLAWYQLRQHLEKSEDPLSDVTNFFIRLPRVKFYTDPYDSSTWPTPWELINENEYCEFNLILGICYTIQLTERFKDIRPTINLALDMVDKNLYYLLCINDVVYGYNDSWVNISELPASLKMQKIYSMKPLH